MELGSEFNLMLSALGETEDNLYSYLNNYEDIVYFDSGRSAIKHIAGSLSNEDKVLLPEFICGSVINCFDIANVSFYGITQDFTIDIEDVRAKIESGTKIIFLMHYFGAIQPHAILEELKDISERNNIVILEDATHSLFSSTHTIGDYVISSIRKWFPIPKGAVFISIHDKLKIGSGEYSICVDNFKAYGMILKDLFLDGKLNCNREYREIFETAENALDKQEDILLMSDFSKFVLRCIDINSMTERRKENYKLLNSILKSSGIKSAVEMNETTCPLAYVLRVPHRDRFRKYLMENHIYCAVHWPADGILESMRMQAVRNANELISLPIDQRYHMRHIDYLARTVLQYGGGLSF